MAIILILPTEGLVLLPNGIIIIILLVDGLLLPIGNNTNRFDQRISIIPIFNNNSQSFLATGLFLFPMATILILLTEGLVLSPMGIIISLLTNGLLFPMALMLIHLTKGLVQLPLAIVIILCWQLNYCYC